MLNFQMKYIHVSAQSWLKVNTGHMLLLLFFGGQKAYCISCYFREGFIFANFASQTLAKISTSIHVYL